MSSEQRASTLGADAAIAALPALEDLGSDTGRRGVPAEAAHSHLFFWITQVAGRRDRLLIQEFRPYGVRVAEWRVLLSIAMRPGISLKEVAEHAMIDQTTLTRIVESMVRAGRIVRGSDPSDMRVTRLDLTEAGDELFETLWPIADRINQSLCTGLPDGAAQLMCHGLREVWRGMERMAPRGRR
ncbi:MarR family winged helix-turn-helix transcriptional regulator [Streptomyces sp. NPDC000927]|uniref:MarR family winged helix-turn-helix transcriptional regulator n=1 Tax=Streptomyces sp. NPDC000927 TaxID=3154371 RepID=UPI003330E3DF